LLQENARIRQLNLKQLVNYVMILVRLVLKALILINAKNVRLLYFFTRTPVLRMDFVQTKLIRMKLYLSAKTVIPHVQNAMGFSNPTV
jgi:hypothetical protein